MNVKITLGLALCFVIGIDIIIGFENATTEGTPQVEEIRRAEFIVMQKHWATCDKD